MQKILKVIYDGELRIAESRDASTPEYRSAMMRFTHVQEKIMDALPKEQRGLVEELSMASADVNGIVCQQDFERGYQLGALLMLAAFIGPLELV